MPAKLTLFLAGPEPLSLRALGNLRALVDGPWSGRAEWEVVDSSAPEAPPSPPAVRSLPALVLREGRQTRWTPAGSPVAEGWLAGEDGSGGRGQEAGGRRQGTGPTTPTLPWRALFDAAPGGCALFLNDAYLVYANPAFRQRHGLSSHGGLGQRPGEWRDARGVPEVEGLLAEGHGPPPVGTAVQRLAVEEGQRLTAAYTPPAAGALQGSGAEPEGARAALQRIRIINHAIGNALVGVIGYGELLLRALEPDNPAGAERARAMTSAAQRVDSLSQEISAAVRAGLGEEARTPS